MIHSSLSCSLRSVIPRSRSALRISLTAAPQTGVADCCVRPDCS